MDLIPSPSQTVGPFFKSGLGWLDDAEQVVSPQHPDAISFEGQVLDGGGVPVPDAVVEIWHADGEGRYPPATSESWRGFGRSLTDDAGRYRFTTIKPGPVAGGSGATQAPHIAVLVFARGLLRPVYTRAYFPDEHDANADDPVLGSVPEARRATLEATAAAGGFWFDVHLQAHGEQQETIFFAP